MIVFNYEDFQEVQIRSENEIMSKWDKNLKAPTVSIVCTTFNHEIYIEDAIKGFLIQETDFPYEIIIHDDASTDNTVNIIKYYQERYPNIIKSICQSNNQFSKGVWPLLLLFNMVAGRYIAICEGDDFWISPDKLQRQYEALGRYPEINICIHSAYSEVLYPERAYSNFGVCRDSETIISAARAILWGGGLCATNSIVIKSEFAKSLPSWVANAPVLDLFIQGLGSFDSGVLYLPYSMSVYRINTSNSWTKKMESSYVSSELLASYDNAFSNYDAETQCRYTREIYDRVAAVFLSGAISSIKFNKQHDFKIRIERSYKAHPALNRTQKLLYRLRHFFKVLRVLYYIYKRE